MFVDDISRLSEMLDFAKEASSIVGNMSKEAFLVDRVRVLAVTRCIEVLGEAANRVTRELQSAHPEIPWAQIVGMRNRLIHGYADIDPERLWVTITASLTDLIAKLQPILDQA